MDHFSFDHLSETEFEQFGYDLLVALGFSAVSWRKGTGLATSPADSGRDLECQLVQKRIDGEPYVEKWFVECKHYLVIDLNVRCKMSVSRSDVEHSGQKNVR